jgi:alkaline phosphatase D
VVIWTRLDPEQMHDTTVCWEVHPVGDPGNLLATGESVVDGDRDGTVQVPVDRLPGGTALAYRFIAEAPGRGSDCPGMPGRCPTIAGVTRTLPDAPTRLRIGVVSCSKYSDGYFNAYRSLAHMGCDLVLHLGDYIYASHNTTQDPLGRWGTVAGREHDPLREAQTLSDYRARYRQYRSDPDLQLLHATVPVVAVWDDNDIANNGWRDGNQAGQHGEVWHARRRAGQRAWSEYHPSRVGQADEAGNLRIWRRISSGNLLDLLMLDTRLQRDEQVSNEPAASTAENDDPSRSMLGPDQWRWLTERLTGTEASDAAWRVIGQGLVMTHWRVLGFPESVGRRRADIPVVAGSALAQRSADGGVYWNSDQWDGYAFERARLFERFADTGDVLVLSGDVHSSWANELVPDANPLNDPAGVELVAPAVSTRPFASNVYGANAVFEPWFTAANPWIKWCDMSANGFLVVDLDAEQAIGRWFQVDTRTPGARARPLHAWVTRRGTRRLLPHVELR